MNSPINDPKSDKPRLAIDELGTLSPNDGTKDISGYVYRYDRDWFYRFRKEGYRSVVWVDVRLDTPE